MGKNLQQIKHEEFIHIYWTNKNSPMEKKGANDMQVPFLKKPNEEWSWEKGECLC